MGGGQGRVTGTTVVFLKNGHATSLPVKQVSVLMWRELEASLTESVVFIVNGTTALKNLIP